MGNYEISQRNLSRDPGYPVGCSEKHIDGQFFNDGYDTMLADMEERDTAQQDADQLEKQ